jgi:hypothetical protein
MAARDRLKATALDTLAFADHFMFRGVVERRHEYMRRFGKTRFSGILEDAS